MSIVIQLGVPVSLSSINVSDIFATSSNGTRIPISVTYSGDLFSGIANASITFFEPRSLVGVLMPNDFGGKWTLKINGIVVFKGFVANMHVERTTSNGYIRVINFKGVTKAWSVTCAAKIFPVGATSETPSDTYTAVDALADLIAIVDTSSMGNTALEGTSIGASVSSIKKVLNNVITNAVTVLIRDMYQEHVLTITNSTYLAEIQRLALYLGCAIFQHPSHDAIAIADVLHPNETFSYEKERSSRASFDVNFETIPATIIVVDDATNNVDSYGYLGSPSVTTNHDFTGCNDIAYASTVGIEKEYLKTIAEQLYKVGLYGSQVLRFKYAGLPPDVEILGRWFQWTDPIGGTGKYVVNKFSTTYKRTSIWTEIEAYMRPWV